MRSLRSALLNAVLVCGTLALGLAAAEITLRLASLAQPVRLGWMGIAHGHHSTDLTDDPQVGYKMWPNRSFIWQTESHGNTYRANSLGFRSDHEFIPSDSRYRIAFVGDSYTWGSGVDNEYTFPSRLEKNSDVVAWNFGIPGFGIDQVWLSSRYKALPLHPDLLVVGVVNADFERSQRPFREGFDKPTFKLVQGQLIQRQPSEKPPNALWRYLDQYSHVWAAWELSKRWVGTHYGLTEYWTLNQAILDALRQDCRDAGVPVLFVYIPISSFKSFPALSDYMRRTEANYIDLTAQRPIPPRSIYLRYDGHLSIQGHRYVANLIEGWIASHPAIREKRRS